MIEKLIERILVEKKTLRDYTRDTVKMFDNHQLLINLDEIEGEMNSDLDEDVDVVPKKDVKKYMNIMILILISTFMVNFYNGLKQEENRYSNYVTDREKIKSDLESDNIPEEINQKFKDNNIDDYKRLAGMIEYMKSDSSIDKTYIYEELRIKMQNDEKLKSLIKNEDYSENEMMTFIAIFINNFIEENK